MCHLANELYVINSLQKLNLNWFIKRASFIKNSHYKGLYGKKNVKNRTEPRFFAVPNRTEPNRRIGEPSHPYHIDYQYLIKNQPNTHPKSFRHILNLLIYLILFYNQLSKMIEHEFKRTIT